VLRQVARHLVADPARLAQQLGGRLELLAVDGADAPRAGPDQLARAGQRLLAGGVLRLELGARPAFDLVENGQLSTTISSRLLIRPLFSVRVTDWGL
jgi:hypothetical protein